MRNIVDRTMACDPHILVTHAPPDGILDRRGYGVPYLTSYLVYRHHRVQQHFFGHAHKYGGHTRREGGVTFVNGATVRPTVYDISLDEEEAVTAAIYPVVREGEVSETVSMYPPLPTSAIECVP